MLSVSLATVALGAAVAALVVSRRLGPGAAGSAESARVALLALVALLLAVLVDVVRRSDLRTELSARAARDAEQKWRSLVENTTDTISVADPEGRIVFVNHPPTGAGPGAPASYFDNVPPEQHDVIRRELARVVSEGEPGLFEVEAGRPDGSRGWFENRLVPLRAEDNGRKVRGVLAIARDVTERHQHEQALQEQAARFRALFENSLDAMVVADDEGRIVDVNPAGCALFGRECDALVGRGIWEWSGTRPVFDAAWARFLTDGEMRGEWSLRLADGRVREVEFTASARFLPGRHLSVLRDVSERRSAERTTEFLAAATRRLGASLDERQTAEALARLAVGEIGDWCGVDLVGEDGRTRRAAVATADPAREAAARELATLYPPDGMGGAVVDEVLRTGEPWMCTELTPAVLEQVKRDAQHLALLQAASLRSVMAVPLASRGRTLGALWFASTDAGRTFGVRELGLARELADRAGVALENARLYREAQDANRAKDEFLATLSHELRTPLNAIVGWAHLLRSGGLDPSTGQRALETIERNARLQSQLIADILDVSRIVSGKLRIESTPVDLAAVVGAAVEAVRPSAAAKDVRLSADLATAGTTVIGDAGRLQQVAQNLLNNALKFTAAGGEVRVALRRSDSSVELVVSDTGVGITPEFLPHVFERFRQSDSSTTRPHGGLGLGLAITRHLVEAHGGSVEAASDGSGLGATFTVRLPVVAGAGAVEDARPEAQMEAFELSGVRVLVVDDHLDGRNLLGTILERAGASVARVGTAREAFAALAEFQPHVLVSDLGLPEEDGYAMLGRMRALPRESGGAIPAVAVTAHARREEKELALSAGFQRHLAKPVDPVEFALVVAQLAQQARPLLSAAAGPAPPAARPD